MSGRSDFGNYETLVLVPVTMPSNRHGNEKSTIEPFQMFYGKLIDHQRIPSKSLHTKLHAQQIVLYRVPI